MNAFLLKEIKFEDLFGTWQVLSKGTAVIVDSFDATLLIVHGDELDYIVRVKEKDYRKYREMN